MSLLKLLGFGDASETDAQSEIEGVRTIVGSLRELDPEKARYLAAFAYIVSRVAHVDQHVSDVETQAMTDVLLKEGQLPLAQAKLVVDIAKAQSVLFGGTEDFLVTREFNAIATHEQKLALLDCLFAVSSADALIATNEDNEIRRIARELHIEHGDYIAARLAHRRHLGVLKPPQ